MKHIAALVLTFVASIFCEHPLAAETKTFYVDTQGRLVGEIPQVRDGDDVRFCIDKGHAGNLHVRYALRDTIGDPAPSGQEKAAFDQEKELQYCDPSANIKGDIVPTGRSKLLTYSVSAPLSAPTQAEKDARKQSLKEAKDKLSQKQGPLETAQARVAQLADEIKQFAGISGATATIEARQTELAKQKDIVKQLAPDVAKLNAEIEGLQTKIAQDDAFANVPESILRMGGIVLGSNRKVVYYHLVRGGPAQLPVHLEQIGPFPILQRDNELYAIITDVSPLQKPDYFALTYTSEIGKPPDSAPLRPSIDQSKAGAGPSEAERMLRLSKATKDFILTFPRKLKANEIVKITISTFFPFVTSDKTTVTSGDTSGTKHEVVTEETNLKLLDAAEYPQVHDLYHYNLATGVVVSSLHDPTFTKVKTGAGATPTFTVVQDNGNKRVFPVMLFSFYYTPKDVVQKWSPKDLVPIPSVGFALSAPADNFFAGGSSEIRRNVQAIYGLHYGRVTARGPIPVDEATSSAAPNTHKQFEPGWFAGLSFNINFIKDLFSGK